MSTPVQLWLLLLVVANMAVPLFFLGQLEAQVVLATFLASVVLMTTLTAVSGFTRLLGLGHVFWILLLWFLWTRLDGTPSHRQQASPSWARSPRTFSMTAGRSL